MHEHREALLPIGEASAATGVPASTLRYYDDRGLVPATARVAGQRRYDDGALRRLRIVAVCQRAGFSLDEIDQLLDGRGDWRALATAKLADIDRRMDELRDARRLVEGALGCDCAHLEACDDTAHDTPPSLCGIPTRMDLA